MSFGLIACRIREGDAATLVATNLNLGYLVAVTSKKQVLSRDAKWLGPIWRMMWLSPIIMMTGCGSLQPKDFAGSKTIFEPDQYFIGHTQSWGVTENRRGDPSSHFTTDSLGKREANGDVSITQRFYYEKGRTQQRLWQVHRIDAIHFEATANDVVGKARGEAQGNVFCWSYIIRVKPGNPFSDVHLRQWMYLPEGTETMFTRAEVKKFGITLQQITESFHHVPETNSPNAAP